jgi:rifampicin phosphotransferase
MKILTVKVHDSSVFKKEAGGKAYNLKRMIDQKIPVPPFLGIGNQFLEAYLEETKVLTKIKFDEDFKRLEKEIDDIFVKTDLPESLKIELREKLAQENLLGGFLAVRSSGLEEDGDALSFAGLFSSFLFQKSEEDIFKSLRRCWASAYSERALSYRKKNGLSLVDIKMGVVVQKMIHSEKAGVIFTKNPINPLDRDNIIVEGVFGQGEGLVSGAFEADQYLVHLKEQKVQATKAEKGEQYLQDAQGGIKKVSIPIELKDKFVLENDEAIELAKISAHIEKTYDTPMDIEWAKEGKDFFILQMRPITTLPHRGFYNDRARGDKPYLWDNSNIIESFSGVTTPLTFSCTKKAYEVVYRQTCKVFNVPNDVIEKHEFELGHMLGFIRGRVYYNLINWYRLLFLIPGAATNQSFMETMMGVKDELSEKDQALFDFTEQVPKYSAFQKLKIGGSLLYRFAIINSIIKDFFAHFNKNYHHYHKLDYSELSFPELLALFENWDKQITYNWTAPIINDFRCMVFFGTLKKLTKNWIKVEGVDTDSLQNDLLCGEGDLESTMPTKTLMKLAEFLDTKDEYTRSIFVNNKIDQVLNLIDKDPKCQEFFSLFKKYLNDYGFRCINEQKLEENDLNDDPSFVINAIQSYIKMKSYNIHDMEVREKAIRAKAEDLVNKNLSGFKKLFYYFILKQARHAVKSRENLRFCRTKSFGIIRKLFRTMGKKLSELGEIKLEKDIFFLSIDELRNLNSGTPLFLNLKDTIKIRKAEYQDFTDGQDPPDRFITRGLAGSFFHYPMVLSQLDLLKSKIKISDDPNLFYGISCCPGVVEKEVRVAKTIEETQNLNGEILVTFRTDPGWVPLYPSCSGLIIERGSLLSHSAVVARELGLPTIVGVNGGIVNKLKTGDRVLLNATKGEIRIVARKGE